MMLAFNFACCVSKQYADNYHLLTPPYEVLENKGWSLKLNSALQKMHT